jgi:hypothetical protein
MAAPVFLTVASGTSASSAFFLSRAGTWAVQVPSMSGVAVRVEFATSSGGSDWAALCPRADLDAVTNSGTVRPAWGLFRPVTSFGRIKTSAAVTDTASFVVLPVNA